MTDQPPTRRGLGSIAAAAIGWLAVLGIVVAAILGLAPVDNPGVQSCGAPALFLLHGEVNTYPDAKDHITTKHGVHTLDKAQLDRAYDHPCSKRVTARMVPAAISLVAGGGLGVLLLIASMVFWWRRDAPKRETAPPQPPVRSPG